MKLIDMANKLGEAMSASNEYLRLLEAERQYKEDPNARELVEKFRKKQEILSFTGLAKDTTDKIRKELTELFAEIEENQIINELNGALNEFLIFKESIFDKIEKSISIDVETLSLNKNHGSKKGCGGCKKGCDS